MSLNIHSVFSRLIVSGFVFFVVLFLIVPHLMDVQPPPIVEALLKPAEWLGRFVGKYLPHSNIGTPEHPVYEGTPFDLLLGFALAFFCILLYPVMTFLFLSLLSHILRAKGAGYSHNLK